MLASPVSLTCFTQALVNKHQHIDTNYLKNSKICLFNNPHGQFLVIICNFKQGNVKHTNNGFKYFIILISYSLIESLLGLKPWKKCRTCFSCVTIKYHSSLSIRVPMRCMTQLLHQRISDSSAIWFSSDLVIHGAIQITKSNQITSSSNSICYFWQRFFVIVNKRNRHETKRTMHAYQFWHLSIELFKIVEKFFLDTLC